MIHKCTKPWWACRECDKAIDLVMNFVYLAAGIIAVIARGRA